jgi:rubrerythrin
METSSLLTAVRIVKENERIAYETYSHAAKVVISLAKPIFEQLSEFEKFHLEKLTALEKSLEEKGEFINYEGKEFILPPALEVKFAENPENRSMLDVISEAIKLEKRAETAYSDLAVEITDPQGHQMFSRLSEEEHKHYEILSDAFWSINQTGVWKWPPSQKGK